MKAKSLEALDKRLSSWRTTLKHLGAQIFDLTECKVYKRMKDQTAISGTTLAKVKPAMAKFSDLQEDFLNHMKIIERADEKRKLIRSIFPEQNKIDDINKRLDETPVWRPLELSCQKLLERLPERANYIESVLKEVDERFHQARKSIDEIKEVLNAAEARGASLSVKADGRKAAHRLKAAQQMLQTDPYAVTDYLSESVQPLVSELNTQIETLAREITQVELGLNKATTRIAEILTLSNQIIEATARCRDELSQPSNLLPPLTANSKSVVRLKQWQADLQAVFDEGNWQSASIGLKEWKKLAKKCLEHQNSALSASQGQLDNLEKAKSRFNAFCTMVASAGQDSRPPLDQLAKQIERRLRKPPIVLDEFLALEESYEREAKRLIYRQDTT